MTTPASADTRPFPVKVAGAHCWECPLYADGQFVPSDGPERAELAIVGEAPGANEARVGRPFIGESGQLLNRLLNHYQIDRKGTLLTNACLCRDPDGATPPSAAIQACRPRLLEELKDRNVKDVVTLGNSAAQAVLATKVGITKLRIGTSRSNEADLPGVRIIPTFHPAACLRVPDFFPSVVTDFGKLRSYSSGWYEPKWKAYEDPETALLALAELQRIEGFVDVDIESQIDKDQSFEQPARHDLLCVGLGYADGKVAVIGYNACHDERVLEALRRYLLSHPNSYQNGKFDTKGLWAKLQHTDFKVAFDTMLASYCSDERRGIHSLDYQGIEKLGAPDWKHEIEKYNPKKNGYGAIPRPVLYKYNAWDVHVTRLLRNHYTKSLQEQRLTKLHDFLCRASDELKFIELNGIGIDLAYNSELHVSYGASLAILEERIGNAIPDQDKVAAKFGWKGGIFNPRSPKQVKEVVKGVFGLPLPRKMNQKREYAETTDADALEELADRSLGTPAEEFFRRMLEHRKEAKLYGTYISGIRKRVYRGRVYPTFLLHGTTTGRLSCRNPNLQNIPRESSMRKQFVPTKPENVFLEADYGQNELRVLCWLAQDEYLREIFNDPTRDLFNELTPVLYGDTSGLSKAQIKELRIRVKAYCMPLDTKILTRRGWLAHNEVKAGDETVGYDLKTGRTRWTKIKAVRDFGNQKTVTLIRKGRGGEQYKFTCTPNHRWVVDKWRSACKQHGSMPKGHYCSKELVETQHMTSNSRITLGGSFASEHKLNITDDEAAIIGWLLTDGTTKTYEQNYITHINISQQKDSPWVPYIDKVLQKVKHTKHLRADGQYIWRILNVHGRDLLARAGISGVLTGTPSITPEAFTFSMSDSQRRSFLEAFCMAEGEKLEQRVVYQNPGWELEVFKLAAYLEGYMVRRHKNGERKCQKFRLCQAKFRKSTIRTEEGPTVPVWCVETELGSWTAKQNGIAFITGNCYGLAYGREARSVALEYDIPVAEAERGMREFFRVIPATVAFRERTRREVLQGNDLTTPLGRHRRFWLITNSNKKDVLNEALAFKPQSIASDICLDAFCHLRPALKGKAYIRNIVHDSQLVECHRDRVTEVAMMMNYHMLEAARRVVGDYVQFKVDIKAGPSWGELTEDVAI